MKRALLALAVILLFLLAFLVVRELDLFYAAESPLSMQDAAVQPPMPKTAPAPVPASAPEPMPEPTPEPVPDPTPIPGDPLRVNGVPLDTVLADDAVYAPAQALAEALAMECSIEDQSAELTAEQTLRFTSAQCYAEVDGQKRLLCRAPITHADTLYLPVEDVAAAVGCTRRFDPESGQVSLTSGIGDWTPPEGYRVPILMYHAVSNNLWGIPELFVDPAELERQLAYLVDNGYDPIWFDDLRNVSQYDKPVILTFDDGYDDNYYELFPLLKKYKVKATIFVICNAFEMNHKLTREQVRELSDSGLVSIQSHGMTHHEMGAMGEAELHFELSESQRILTEITGKEPFVVSYPVGSYSDLTIEVARQYYRFGTKMNGHLYTTGDEPMLANRFYVSRFTTIEGFAQLLTEDYAA